MKIQSSLIKLWQRKSRARMFWNCRSETAPTLFVCVAILSFFLPPSKSHPTSPSLPWLLNSFLSFHFTEEFYSCAFCSIF